MRQIVTRKGEIKAIAAALKVCRKTVGEALLFKTDTELARKIREMAKERGGKETEYTNEKR